MSATRGFGSDFVSLGMDRVKTLLRNADAANYARNHGFNKFRGDFQIPGVYAGSATRAPKKKGKKPKKSNEEN